MKNNWTQYLPLVASWLILTAMIVMAYCQAQYIVALIVAVFLGGAIGFLIAAEILTYHFKKLLDEE
jgi:hypothetical protein